MAVIHHQRLIRSGQIVDLSGRPAEVGRIKIGQRGPRRTSSGGATFQPPQKLNHFRITKMHRDEHGAQNFVVDEAAHRALGSDTPRELPIRLAYHGVEQNWFSSYTFYRGRKLACAGNGETAWRRLKDRDEAVEVACTCEYLDGKRCKPYGIFRCLLDVPGIPSIGGVYVFRTHSKYSIANIQSSLNLFAVVTSNRLANIPMELRLIDQEIEIPREDGGMQRTVIHVVALQFRDTMDQLERRVREAIEARRGSEEMLRAIEAQAADFGVDADADADADDELVDVDADDELVDDFDPDTGEVVMEDVDEPERPKTAVIVLGKPYQRLGAARTAMLRAIAGASEVSDQLSRDAATLATTFRAQGRDAFAGEIEAAVAKKRAAKRPESEDDDAPPEVDGPPVDADEAYGAGADDGPPPTDDEIPDFDF